MDFLLVLGILLIVTKVVESFSVKVGLPSVVGSLGVGIVLGPALLNIIQESSGITLLSHIGVMLLMFLAGLESDFSILKKYLRPSFIVATLGIVIPVVCFYLCSVLFGLSGKESLFIGLIFGATSLSITIQVLKELNYVKTKEGAIVIGAALLDDIMVVVLLNVVLSLFTPGSSNTVVVKLLVTIILFFIGVYLVNRFVLPFILKAYKHVNIPEKNVSLGLGLAFLLSFIAESIGMSDIIGAFFAGIMLSQTDIGHEIETKVESMNTALFAPIFFVSIGLGLSFKGLGSYWLMIVVFSLLAIITKFAGGYIGAKTQKLSSSSASIIGASLISRGEMALIMVAIGKEQAIVSSEIYALIVLVVLISTIAAPIILKKCVENKQKEEDV